jgi:hypothetical protein
MDEDGAPWKVAYEQENGYESTAYVYPKYDHDGNFMTNVLCDATNKHTDAPLKLMYTGEVWVEVPL